MKSEKCAVIITVVFLALVLGFSLGRGERDASFTVTESAFSAVKVGGGAETPGGTEGADAGGDTDHYNININTATAQELELLDGIGSVIAERIVAYREQEGEFKTIEDITKVKGIGAATFENIRGHISVD